MNHHLPFLLLCLTLVTAARSVKKKFRIDKEHIKMDFLKIFGSWSDVFSDAEMNFRYFIAHDQDNNRKLDGLELFTALEHDAKHEAEEHEGEEVTTEELERDVEEIFADHDSDGDGFLDYKEFLSVQRIQRDIKKKDKAKSTEEEL